MWWNIFGILKKTARHDNKITDKKFFNDFKMFAKCNCGISDIYMDRYFRDMTRLIIEERDTRFREVDVFSRLIMDRIIFLGSPINSEVANIIVAQLLYLSTINNNNISMYINSPGGEIYSGLAIYDTMQFIKPKVQTVCIGLCASMAAVILASGNKGNRSALPHSRIMIHQPWGEAKGQATEIEITYKEIKILKQELCEILAKHSGRTSEQIALDFERDYWMKAEEAQKYGLIDSIYCYKNKEENNNDNEV